MFKVTKQLEKLIVAAIDIADTYAHHKKATEAHYARLTRIQILEKEGKLREAKHLQNEDMMHSVRVFSYEDDFIAITNAVKPFRLNKKR
jgi:hypothetical protein